MTAMTETYRGGVRSVRIGGLEFGGGGAFPLHAFDGELPCPPRVCMEMWDTVPDDWSPELVDVFADVWSDPVAWASRLEESGADALYVRLRSADPHGESRPVTEVVERARRIVEAVTIPCLIIGCGDPDTDVRLMPAVAEVLSGHRVAVGNAESDTYQEIGRGTKENGQVVIAYTPMDVSLAKQLNVLLAQSGIADTDIIMDPTCSALGYSFEYAYTVFERDRLAALVQNDAKMQAPLLATVGQETWHVKESRAGDDELPGYGPRYARGILWESVTAMGLILAGADAVVVRHPDSARLIRQAVTALSDGSDSWR